MVIRSCRMNDAPVIHRELGCNPEMLRYTGWNPYATLEQTEKFLAGAIEAEDKFSWIIEQDGAAVGMIGAYDYSPEDGSIEIGYSVFQKCWGKGYASQAVALACNELYSRKHIRCIKAWSAAENAASRIVLEKNGFVKTETIESAINVDGNAFDQVFYERRGANL